MTHVETKPSAARPARGRAEWIARHPWQLIRWPLVVAAAAIGWAATDPGATYEAVLLFMTAAGVAGLVISVYLFALQSVALRRHPVLGLIGLVIDGWRVVVILLLSALDLLIVAHIALAR